MTLYFMMFSKHPFEGNSYPALYNKIINDEPEFPMFASYQAKDLILRRLEKDPATRITVAEIKKHAWVTCGGVEPMEALKQGRI